MSSNKSINKQYTTKVGSSDLNAEGTSTVVALQPDATPEEKAAFHRERNRQHARSTRARKKAYVNKLKELVEHLHMERTEEARKRRLTASTRAEMVRVRKAVIMKFLDIHSDSSSNLASPTDTTELSKILDQNCTLKQPITPYRWFNRKEIVGETRISRGIHAILADCASMSVMIANIGSRSSRWANLKRFEFLNASGLTLKNRSSNNQSTSASFAASFRQQQAISSLSGGSSSAVTDNKSFPSDGSNGSGSGSSSSDHNNHNNKKDVRDGSTKTQNLKIAEKISIFGSNLNLCILIGTV